MSKQKHDGHHVGREKVALMALRQGMAIIKNGLEVFGLHEDGSKELISRSTQKGNVWDDAAAALKQNNVVKTTMNKDTDTVGDTAHLKIFSDGGSRGNPGPSASGYVITTTDDTLLEEGGEYLGITTNNQAEYQAVKLALESAAKYKPQEVEMYMDSMLVVNQLNGIYKVKSRELWPVYDSIKQLAATFPKVTFQHVYREANTLADGMVNKILDAQKNSIN